MCGSHCACVGSGLCGSPLFFLAGASVVVQAGRSVMATLFGE